MICAMQHTLHFRFSLKKLYARYQVMEWVCSNRNINHIYTYALQKNTELKLTDYTYECDKKLKYEWKNNTKQW
jgi:hypothetical protein